MTSSAAICTAAAAAAAAIAAVRARSATFCPHRYLEQVEGQRALAWVKGCNAATLKAAGGAARRCCVQCSKVFCRCSVTLVWR